MPSPSPYVTPSGRVLPRVSDVLDVVNWGTGYVPRGVLQAAYAEGHLIHAAIAACLRADPLAYAWALGVARSAPPPSSGRVLTALNAFQGWIASHVVAPVAVEAPIVDAWLGVGGTPDVVGLVDGVAEVVDWKGVASFETFDRLLPRYRVQVAAYGLLARDKGHDVDRLRIVALNKDDGSHVDPSWSWEELARDRCTFRAAVELYEARHGAALTRSSA